jgi:hypothetical protein
MSTDETPQDWVPQACTLPTEQRPLRAAEFDELFAGALIGLDRAAPNRLRLVLDATAEPTARDLTARETECCSFFDFTFGRGEGGSLMLDITVPAAHIDVLDALAARAEACDGGVAV